MNTGNLSQFKNSFGQKYLVLDNKTVIAVGLGYYWPAYQGFYYNIFKIRKDH